YCVSCDWSQLVTWYKAVVNSLVPCDLYVVSNDVSDYMIGTSHRRSHTAISVPLCPRGHSHPPLHCSCPAHVYKRPDRSSAGSGGR
ncbi:unnamed protein product, partial [Staurois parvus]